MDSIIRILSHAGQSAGSKSSPIVIDGDNEEEIALLPVMTDGEKSECDKKNITDRTVSPLPEFSGLGTHGPCTDSNDEDDILLLTKETSSSDSDTADQQSMTQAMKNEGFVHASVPDDGRCCYYSMSNIVNFDKLACTEEKETRLTKTVSIIHHLKKSLELLTRKNISRNHELRKELSELLEAGEKSEDINTVISDMISRMEGFLSNTSGKLPRKYWGSSRMFGLLGLLYQIQVKEYHMTLPSKKNRKKVKIKKPSCTRTIPTSLADYPETREALGSMILPAGGRLRNEGKQGYIISFHNEHFDTWLTREQAEKITKFAPEHKDEI